MPDNDQRVCFLNGRILPVTDAHLSVEDRGTMFADGVYEVVRYYGGRSFHMQSHIDRLRAGCEAIDIEPGDVPGQLAKASDELVARHGNPNAKVYWQVTRGAEPRKHVYSSDLTPTVLAIASDSPSCEAPGGVASIAATLTADVRWMRCSIKTTMLLPNVLAVTRAKHAGYDEAIMHRDNIVTEATAASVLIVRQTGTGPQLHTHPANDLILGSITRRVVLKLAADLGLPVVEEPFDIDTLRSAREVMLAGTTRHVTAVTRVDETTIGDGTVGSVTRSLHEVLIGHVREHCQLV